MTLSVVLAQKNWLVGDIEGNAARIIQTINNHQHNDLVIFSEMALCGYLPEDLLFRDDFRARCEAELANIAQASKLCGVIVGHPTWQDGHIYNSLSFFYQGQRLALYHKQQLPNYDVFDEKRYFTAGAQSGIVDFKGYRLGLLICEDLWQAQPIEQLISQGIELLITINASPYDYQKVLQRQQLLEKRAKQLHAPIIYVNQVGGQDELIFDGQSLVCDANGQIVSQFDAFVELSSVVNFDHHLQVLPKQPLSNLPTSIDFAHIYNALVLAVRDYVTKNGFQGVVLGLSGGIDSALTLAIAVDALGKDKVHAVMMPFKYTAEISIADAQEQATLLGVEFDIISIAPIFDAFMQQLTPLFEATQPDTTEENLQARCRGVILMALSNKRRRLVLTTGNKSEMSVGYATLYGDMAGGFDVLKDVPKTWVFKLACYRNTHTYAIPQRVITRPPSAELAPDQKDEDSLPPYPILDAILRGYIENQLSIEALVAQGYDETTVRKVIKLVDINEYKRRQSPIGPKITACNFGKGRRYPITSGFRQKNG